MANEELSVVTRDQVDALLATLSKRSSIGARNAAMILTLARTGIRIGELLALRISDVDFSTRTIRVRKGKGAKPRTVGCDDVTLASLQRWFDRRRLVLKVDDRIAIFCSTSGRPISDSAVRELLKRLAKRAGLDGVKVSPHGFRRGFVHRLSAAGIPISVISQACGHANVLTTFIYLQRRTGLGNESVAALRNFNWE